MDGTSRRLHCWWENTAGSRMIRKDSLRINLQDKCETQSKISLCLAETLQELRSSWMVRGVLREDGDRIGHGYD